MEFLCEFHPCWTFERCLNTTFLALILKKGGMGYKDLRPISLICGLYKLLVKTLANRLRKKKNHWRGDFSTPKILLWRGDKILDVILLANEAIDSRVESLRPGVSLLSVLELIGLNQTWEVNKILHFYSLVFSTYQWFFSFFHSLRGSRHKDLFSPCSFWWWKFGVAFCRWWSKEGLLKGFKVKEPRGGQVEI